MESGQNSALFAENEPFRATKMWNELVKNFKCGVRLKRKRWRMKYYEDCFSGSEALAWIHDFLKLNPNFGHNVSRTQAKLLCQKLLQRHVFADVVLQFKSARPVFEESHLYHFSSKPGIKNEGKISVTADGKENANLKLKGEAQSSRKAAVSSLKRHASFSDRLQFSRKPLGERKALQNISKDVDNKNNLKQVHMKSSKKHGLKNEKDGPSLVLQNLDAVNSKSEQTNARLRGKSQFGRKVMSGLSKKWKSEYDVTLIEENEETFHEDTENNCDDRNPESVVCQGNKHTKLGATTDDNTEKDGRKECSPLSDLNELWMNICLERLRHVLNVNSLEDILAVDLLSGKNVMENIKSADQLRCVTEAVPKWLVSAMKCLIHWPQSIEDHGAGGKSSGFERDIFKTIQEHFELLPEPLIAPNFIEVFTKISGLTTKCKLSAIRALQLTLLMLTKNVRQQLQLLLRFMIKISKNHQLNLSGHLPTRELVIQTFVPCIFGKRTVHETLGIRITSFIMENYGEVFKVPDGLMFEVEQQIAFCKGKTTNGGTLGNDVTYCLRVTKEEFEEQKKLGTQRFLGDLLDSIVHDQKINEKERKKKLKQFQKTYPEIYYSRYPQDDLSVMSQHPEKLRRVMKPFIRRQMKHLR